MAGVRITYRDSIAARLMRYDRSRRRAILDRPLGAAPASEKPLEIRETARVAALFDIVEQMPSAAIAIFPARGEKRLKVMLAQRRLLSVGWRLETHPFGDAAPAVAGATCDLRIGQTFSVKACTVSNTACRDCR